MKRWARISVDAALAGEPEPPRPGYPVKLARYWLGNDGNVTRVSPSGMLRNVSDPEVGGKR